MATKTLLEPYTQDLNLKTSEQINISSQAIKVLEETQICELNKTYWNEIFKEVQK